MRSMVEGPTAQPSDCVRRPSTPAFGGVPAPPDGGGRNGFTLVELLIVLVIVGLMSAAVVLAIPDPSGGLMAEAERFAARAKAAQDHAVIDARAMSVRITAAGYGFDSREPSGWRPLGRKPFADQAWGEGVRPELAGEGVARIIFDSTGIAEPAQLRLVRDDEQVVVELRHDGSIHVSD